MLFFSILALGLPSLLYAIYSYFKSLRRIHDKIPSLPRNLLFGNMLDMGKYIKPKKHPDYGLKKLWEDLGSPDIFFLDVLPIHGLLIIAHPTIAEQLTKSTPHLPYSTPKSFTVKDIEPLIGKQSIISREGEEWKTIRKQFQPGFQPTHLKTLLPQIIDEVKVFLDKLEEKVVLNRPFRLAKLTSNMALDVISNVVLGRSFHAQTVPEGEGVKGPEGLLTAFLEVQNNVAFSGDISKKTYSPWRIARLSRYTRILDQRMEDMIKTAIADSEVNEKFNSSRSVVHLALKDREITPATIRHAADQLRSFIFAGFDTTSTLLQWTFYYLSLPENSAILEDLISEHDTVLGPLSNPSAIESILTADPLLPLTTAVIKETLRLQPPASSARWVPSTNAPVTITIPSDNSTHTINGSVIYLAHGLMHTSPKIWGPDALTFRPSRWLDKEYVATLPPGSWRPFERGPRGCIGQELALLEAKVALALTVRLFAFTKVDEEGRESGVVSVEEKPDLWTGEGEVWNKYVITASPADGMRMRVRKR